MAGGEPSFLVFHSGRATKWHRAIELCCTSVELEYSDYPPVYSVSEALKLLDYILASGTMLRTLALGPGDAVVMEGYAARASGHVADIIALGTMLRVGIAQSGAGLSVVAPMSIKTVFASLAYAPDAKGVCRNASGVAGGKFTKTDMLRCLFDLPGDCDFRRALRPYRDELLSAKNVPSPINDCVDAYAAATIAKLGLVPTSSKRSKAKARVRS